MSHTPHTNNDDLRAQLADGLKRRPSTVEVARLITELGLPLTGAAKHELKALRDEYVHGMATDYEQVSDASRQTAVYGDLFDLGDGELPDNLDVAGLRALVYRGLGELGFTGPGSAGERLSELKGVHGVKGSTRKRLRYLRRLEEKADRIAAAQRLRAATTQGKSRLSYLVDASRCSDASLAFIAYLSARAGRRSVFQVGSQSKAQDTLSDALMNLLVADESTDWAQVALVKPTVGVLRRVPARERGELLGLFHSQMVAAARELATMWPSLPERMREEMVMVRGVPSTGWNAYAGALNTMRSAWVSAMIACDLEDALEEYLPGKAPRLMASDLVWGYRNGGKELHIDTVLFNALPRPWDVVTGQAELGRQQIIDAATSLDATRRQELDVLGSGWVGPRRAHDRETPSAEPALVHGVVVADPALAQILRRCGVFSGKMIRHEDEMPDEDSLDATLSLTPRNDGLRPVIVRASAEAVAGR